MVVPLPKASDKRLGKRRPFCARRKNENNGEVLGDEEAAEAALEDVVLVAFEVGEAAVVVDSEDAALLRPTAWDEAVLHPLLVMVHPANMDLPDKRLRQY